MHESLRTQSRPDDTGASRVEYSLLMAAVAALVAAIVLAVVGLAHTAADTCRQPRLSAPSSQCG